MSKSKDAMPGSQQQVVRGELRYYKTVRTKRDGGETRTHLEGIGDSYTLCGLDTAGDDKIHGKPPIELPPGKHRITCELCLQTISIVREHLKASNEKLSQPAGNGRGA